MSLNLPLVLSTVSGCGIGALVFMRLARKYGLHDHPNGRSSHRQATVTGMGIILVLAFIIYLCWQPFVMPRGFIIGFFLLTIISFLDDLFFLKHSLRLLFQIVAVTLLVWQLPFQSTGAEAVALAMAAIVFAVGVLNAYNFMDGINGMLTLHSLLVLSCMLFLNETLTDMNGLRLKFTSSQFLLAIIIPMAIFGFFNIRNRALAFIGDVGSIGVSFIIVFLMYNLLLKTGNYTYLLLFSVFGADAGLTVVYKLILRENIFVPHRDFLFKKLVHLRRIPHLAVSFGYFAVQLFINVIVIFASPRTPKLSTQLSILFLFMILLVAAYIWIQTFLGRTRNGVAASE